MKKRVGELDGKPIVVGDPNIVTSNEILLEELESNKIDLKTRNWKGELESVCAGGGSGSTSSMPNVIFRYAKYSEAAAYTTELSFEDGPYIPSSGAVAKVQLPSQREGVGGYLYHVDTLMQININNIWDEENQRYVYIPGSYPIEGTLAYQVMFGDGINIDTKSCTKLAILIYMVNRSYTEDYFMSFVNSKISGMYLDDLVEFIKEAFKNPSILSIFDNQPCYLGNHSTDITGYDWSGTFKEYIDKYFTA